LKDYLVRAHSPTVYANILEAAGFESTHFDTREYFSDEDLNRVLEAAEAETNLSRDALLTANGKMATPALLEATAAMIDPSWKTLDLVEAVEGRMHTFAREEMAAFPPVLKTERVSENELIVRSRSHRRMWGLAVGFMYGFAEHYGETITVDVDIDGHTCVFTLRKTA
jgi:hypothetical protein